MNVAAKRNHGVFVSAACKQSGPRQIIYAPELSAPRPLDAGCHGAIAAAMFTILARQIMRVQCRSAPLYRRKI